MPDPVITPNITARTVSHDILGPSKVRFCPSYQTVDAVQVSALSRPDTTTAASAWRDIGRASNFSPTPETSTIEVNECTESGAWRKHKETKITAFSLSWQSSQMSPEAWQLLFATANPIKDDDDVPLASAGAAQIEGWLCIEIKRSQNGALRVESLYAYGKLSLKTPPQFMDDFAKPEFLFEVDPDVALSTITFANIQTITP